MYTYICVYSRHSQLEYKYQSPFEVGYIISRVSNGSVQAIWNQEAKLGLRTDILHYVPPPVTR
jgi:hypothetical protein